MKAGICRPFLFSSVTRYETGCIVFCMILRTSYAVYDRFYADQKEKSSMGNDSQERVSINSFGGRTEKLISPFVG